MRCKLRQKNFCLQFLSNFPSKSKCVAGVSHNHLGEVRRPRGNILEYLRIFHQTFLYYKAKGQIRKDGLTCMVFL